MNIEPLRHRYLRFVVAPMLRALGQRATSRLATALARGVYQLDTPAGRLARQRITAAWHARLERMAAGDCACPMPRADRPHRSRLDVGDLLAAMYGHVARFWVEVLFARRLMRPDRWETMFEFERRDELERLATGRRGCLLATGYYGSLTMGAFALGQIFRPVHVVADAATQPGLAAWQRSLSRIDALHLLDRREAVHEVPAVLQRGGAVLMVCEQSRRRGLGVPARFLGESINAYVTLERLARWYDVPVAVVTCRREPQPMRFKLACHSIHEWRETNSPATSGGNLSVANMAGDDLAAAKTGRLTRDVLASLERAIWTEPAQYLWTVPPVQPTNHRAAAGATIQAPSASLHGASRGEVAGERAPRALERERPPDQRAHAVRHAAAAISAAGV